MRFIALSLFVLVVEHCHAQTTHLVLFDTEEVEWAGVNVLRSIQDAWKEIRANCNPSRDDMFFLTEFNDNGDFDSNLIVRHGLGVIDALVMSDSLNTPVGGCMPHESRWLQQLATTFSKENGKEWRSLKVTMLSLQASGDNVTTREELLYKLAVILNRTNPEGEMLPEDSWNFLNPITHDRKLVWN